MEPLFFIPHTWGPPHVTHTYLIMLLLIVFGWVLSRNLSLVPGHVQNVVEIACLAIGGLATTLMGERAKKFYPLIFTLMFFIFTSNIIGLIPGFDSPTNNLNTTIPMALVVFILTHYIGIREHGFKYIKQFLGPVWWLAWLIFPIEVISHLSRPLSLSVRLFGNIRGEDLVLIILLLLVPFFVPLLMMGMIILTSVLQTFVFVLLTIIYISGALEEGH